MTSERTDQQRAAISAVKAERDRDKVAAMQEYLAERLAAQANFTRLRAQRLAREAAQAGAAAAAAADKSAKKAEKKPARRTATARPAKTDANTDREQAAS